MILWLDRPDAFCGILLALEQGVFMTDTDDSGKNFGEPYRDEHESTKKSGYRTRINVLTTLMAWCYLNGCTCNTYCARYL